jgi:hypothetical protein
MPAQHSVKYTTFAVVIQREKMVGEGPGTSYV